MPGRKIERRVWQCPVCEQRYNIPASAKDPKLCPQCEKARIVEPPTGVSNDTTSSMSVLSVVQEWGVTAFGMSISKPVTPLDHSENSRTNCTLVHCSRQFLSDGKESKAVPLISDVSPLAFVKLEAIHAARRTDCKDTQQRSKGRLLRRSETPQIRNNCWGDQPQGTSRKRPTTMCSPWQSKERS